MKRSDFRNLIKECVCELLNEGTFDHMVESANNEPLTEAIKNIMIILKEDDEIMDKHSLAREVGRYLTQKIGNKQSEWPSFDDFQAILSNQRALRMLSKYPIEKAAQIASEMILAVAGSHLKEEKEKKLRSIISELKKS